MENLGEDFVGPFTAVLTTVTDYIGRGRAGDLKEPLALLNRDVSNLKYSSAPCFWKDLRAAIERGRDKEINILLQDVVTNCELEFWAKENISMLTACDADFGQRMRDS